MKKFYFLLFTSILFLTITKQVIPEEKNIFPNISFGKNFVSITIFLSSEKMSTIEKEFSNQIDSFYLDI